MEIWPTARKKKKFGFTLRKAKFNQYEENIIDTEELLPQGSSRPLIVMAGQFHRHLQGRKIYAALQGWEYISDAIGFRGDTETKDEPQSEPDNAPTNNKQFKEETTRFRDCCQRSWQCICADIFPGGKYGRTKKNHIGYNDD